MPGTTPEKRPRQDTQASEVPIPKCDLNTTKRTVLKFAKLSDNAYAPTKGKFVVQLLLCVAKTYLNETFYA